MARNTFGNTFNMAADGVTPLVKVANLLTFTPPKFMRNMVEVTDHDSADGAEEVIPDGTHRYTPFSATMHYVKGSAADLALIAAKSGGLLDCEVVVKTAAGTDNVVFSGYLEEYGPDEQPVSGKQTASFTIRVTGVVTD